MKKIYIHYWNINPLIPCLRQGGEYPIEKLSDIIQIIMEAKLNLMIVSDHGDNNDVLIMIDKGRFRQS